MMRGAWILAAVLIAVSLTGCVGTGPTETTEVTPSTAKTDETREPLPLEGTGCTMGGGQSVHPREGLVYGNLSEIVPEPWHVDGVLEDTGPQYTYSQWPKPTAPKPEEGDTWGHYHATTVCDGWTVDGERAEDVIFGFVGAKVETPGFASTSADDEYLATVVATNHAGLFERLQRGGVDVMEANASIETTGQDLKRVSMSTTHNGEYLSIYSLNELGPIEDRHVRLWFQHQRDDGSYAPVAIDLYRDGGTHFGDQGEGYFHHQRTAHHWPLPGAYGHTAAVHYEGFDLTLEWGPTPNATLEHPYHH